MTTPAIKIQELKLDSVSIDTLKEFIANNPQTEGINYYKWALVLMERYMKKGSEIKMTDIAAKAFAASQSDKDPDNITRNKIDEKFEELTSSEDTPYEADVRFLIGKVIMIKQEGVEVDGKSIAPMHFRTLCHEILPAQKITPHMIQAAVSAYKGGDKELPSFEMHVSKHRSEDIPDHIEGNFSALDEEQCDVPGFKDKEPIEFDIQGRIFKMSPITLAIEKKVRDMNLSVQDTVLKLVASTTTCDGKSITAKWLNELPVKVIVQILSKYKQYNDN